MYNVTQGVTGVPIFSL